MNAKTYRVKNLREALDLIREDFGPDASVVHTRRLEPNWLARLCGAPLLEVIASLESSIPSRLENQQAGQPQAMMSNSHGIAKEMKLDTKNKANEPAADPELPESSNRLPFEERGRQPKVDKALGSQVGAKNALTGGRNAPSHWSDVRASLETTPTQTNGPIRKLSLGSLAQPRTDSESAHQVDEGLAIRTEEKGIAFERQGYVLPFPNDGVDAKQSSHTTLSERPKAIRSSTTRTDSRWVASSNEPTNGHSRFRTLPNSLETALIGSGFREAVIAELLETWNATASANSNLDPEHHFPQWLGESFSYLGPIESSPLESRIVCFVGPTGVGKTTTLAKVAAHFHLRQGVDVGLITVDTFRIAAVEQLRTYAKIMGVAMEVVGSPSEMKAALARLQNNELILIDTAGGSPRNLAQIQELKEVVLSANPAEINLVLSAGSNPNSFRHSVDAFGEMGVTSLTISKVDEANGLGHLWEELNAAHLPLRYVTTGQNVPDDFVVASSRTMGSIALGKNESTELDEFERRYSESATEDVKPNHVSTGQRLGSVQGGIAHA